VNSFLRETQTFMKDFFKDIFCFNFGYFEIQTYIYIYNVLSQIERRCIIQLVILLVEQFAKSAKMKSDP